MSTINLIPWREELKAQKDKRFYFNLFVASCIAVALGVAAWFAGDQVVKGQQERNTFLKEEISKLDKKIVEITKLKEEIANMLKRMDTINRLQESRNHVVHLLNDLPSFVSSGIYLDKIAFKNGVVAVNGATEAHLRVVSMIRAIEASPWLKDPVIKDIKSATNTNSVVATAAKKFGLNLNNFDMSFKVPFTKEQTASNNKNRGSR